METCFHVCGGISPGIILIYENVLLSCFLIDGMAYIIASAEYSLNKFIFIYSIDLIIINPNLKSCSLSCSLTLSLSLNLSISPSHHYNSWCILHTHIPTCIVCVECFSFSFFNIWRNRSAVEEWWGSVLWMCLCCKNEVTKKK